MSWHARLSLHYALVDGRTVARDAHEGPLRVLKALYPEGPARCHHVIVHPPGGIVGGDRLEIDARLDGGTHALFTTPGAARFYRSDGAAASQTVRLSLAEGARAEWLPLETICHQGCLGSNRVTLQLAPGAQVIGWDLLALGLPAAGEPFDRGRFEQHLELPGVWLERGRIDAADVALLDSPLGLAGARVLATMWFAAGEAFAPALRERLLDAAREEQADGAFERGATSPDARIVLVRALAQRVEPMLGWLRRLRVCWRREAWALPGAEPRVWST